MDIEKGLMGTLKTVFGQVGELAYLNVVNVSEMGAFLDLGIGKDVLLLKNKMETELKIGDDALVALRLDNKNRIGATMKISDYIEVRPNSTVGEEVSGIVYRVNDEMGIFVAVEGKYHGFIHNNKLTKKYFVGETVNAKIAKVRDDGKLELAFRDVAYKVMDNDAKVILDYLNKNKGIMTLNDDSSPEDIKRVFGISKKAFKDQITFSLPNSKIGADIQIYPLVFTYIVAKNSTIQFNIFTEENINNATHYTLPKSKINKFLNSLS
jgi:predicted RNA-binding protein (virulence factor B family)